MIRYGIFLSILFFIGILCSCANNSVQSKHKEVTISDKNRTGKNGEIMIDDRDLDYHQRQISTTVQSIQETPQLSADGSQVRTMIDGFGNRIETRIFSNHPLLQGIILRTFADGRKRVFVYGQNGDVSSLPDEMQEKAMNAPAADLARSAGIFTGRDENNLPYFLQMLRQKTVETLVPTYQFPTTENISEPTMVEPQTPEIAPAIEPSVESTPVIPEQKQTPERNYQADINKILLQSNKRRTAKTEATLTQNKKSEKVEEGNK